MIARALREAPACHRYDSALDAKMTLICVLVACLFPNRIAGSHVEIIDDCGHEIQADQPDAAWAAISKFLAT